MPDTAPLPQTPQQRRRRFASARSIMALVLREMGSTYGRSPGGYLWAVLEPIGAIALLSLVFSAAFRNPALGISFPLFYATGMMPFNMFTDVHGKMATALMYSKQLLVYPTVTYLDALMARLLLNVITQTLISYLVLAGCLLAFENRVSLDLPVVILSFVMAAALALGLGTLNSFMFTRFPVWQRAWSILMRPMFLISGIFFLFESLPQQYQGGLWWNPLIHIIGMMRRGFYAEYDATYVSVTYVFLVSLVSLAFGLLLLRRHHRDLLNN